MLIEPWDTSTLDEQERTIGRTKGAGAPLGQRQEFDPVDFTKQVDGEFAIPETSHVFLAHPTNSGTAILRRGYSFVDGSDGLGRLDAGLFFIAYQRDPATGFVQVQRNLRLDAHERVHPAHVLRRVRLPARRAGGRRLVGPGALRGLTALRRGCARARTGTRRAGAPHQRAAACSPAGPRPLRSTGAPCSMCRHAPKWTPSGDERNAPGSSVAARSQPGRTARSDPPWSNQDDGAWATATSCTS